MIGYKDKTLMYEAIDFNKQLQQIAWSCVERAKGKLKRKYIYWSKC